MDERTAHYEEGSLSLPATVAMGTGVMIGAGIFALTGQVAELSGGLFAGAFVVAAAISGLSSYSYIKVASKYPSAGGVAMILKKAYGKSIWTGGAALLMAFSMVINQSLVARTFGSYTIQLFPDQSPTWWVPVLAVALVAVAFVVNIAGNRIVGVVSKISAVAKIGGLFVFAAIAVVASGADLRISPWPPAGDPTPSEFAGAVALAILAFKGFTTITNSGGEIENPQKNLGRAIVISLAVCLVVYLAVCFAVASSLTIEQLVESKNYALARAARPAIGGYGTKFTVALAMIATASGLLASVFAVSRMLAMLTEMELIPHSHFGMPGDVQKHTLVYTVVVAAALAAFFDLSRIASMGAIFYLVMDMVVHSGVLRHLREDVDAAPLVTVAALALDGAALAAFIWVKMNSDPWIVVISLGSIGVVFAFEKLFLRRARE